MQYFSPESIEELLPKKGQKPPAITIYMPTHPSPTPPHMHEDQIRFKNLYNKALEILKTRNEPNDIIRSIQEQFGNLKEEKTFWEAQAEALLLCVRPGFTKWFNLPMQTEEYVSVDSHFHLAPVHALLNDNQDYYLLVLAEHDPSLYKGSMYYLSKSRLKLPESLESALNLDEINQFHTNGGSSAGQFHGQGGVRDIGGEERLKYFRIIDQLVCSQSKDLPLIIAATEEEYAAYKDISHYPLITKGFINGNHTRTEPSSLLLEAQKIIKDEFIRKHKNTLIDRFKRLSGEAPSLASSAITSIKDAAEKGRVDTLLLAIIRKTHDTVQDGKDSIHKIVFPDQSIMEPFDYLTRLVWSQGGAVYAVAEDSLPKKSPLAAIYRY